MKLLFAILIVSFVVLLGCAIAGYWRVRRYRNAIRVRRLRGGPETVTLDVKRELKTRV